MIRIIIADDHALVRAGVKRILAAAPDMAVVAEAQSCDDLTRVISAYPCDALLLDIGLRGGDGLELLPALKKLRPSLPVIIFTIYEDSRAVAKALKAGAAGYIVKTDPPGELVRAVRRCLAGQKYVSRAFRDLVEDCLYQEERSLSPREREVLELLGMGKRNGEIAQELGLSHKTVSTYRAHILEKLQLRSNGELLHHVFKRTS